MGIGVCDADPLEAVTLALMPADLQVGNQGSHYFNQKTRPCSGQDGTGHLSRVPPSQGPCADRTFTSPTATPPCLTVAPATRYHLAHLGLRSLTDRRSCLAVTT
ncbi:hypothetical protein GCM10009639_70930 [Kitasatospora putterlickiae]|uniref:Uncharacterized protein n=1 Tax=Kitasatospora putterlickiae TaxID=221725 RepID=A0ABN1YLC0_9ACTN